MLGVVAPALVGVMSMPVLLHNLGADRLGIFSLALGLIGFSGLFDLGLARALTQAVARSLGQGAGWPEIAALWRQTLFAVAVLGGLWCALLWMLAPTIVNALPLLDPDLAEETLSGIRWLAVGVPLLLMSTSGFGLLEGLQRFGQVNLVRVPLNLLSFLAPVLASFWGRNVDYAIACLVMVRLLAMLWLGVIVTRTLPADRAVVDKARRRELWRFGGWLTVSNLISPLMVHADRFYLATVLSPATVALYTVPLDAVMRATVFPSAAMNAFFPALASTGGRSGEAAGMVRDALRWIFSVWAVGAILVASSLDWWLALWLGPDFATQVLSIVKWLLLGVLANGFAHLPLALLQSAGRADVTGKLHILELPLYAALLYFLVSELSILGAAVAWAFRVLLDSALLYFMAYVTFDGLRPAIAAVLVLIITSMVGLVGILFFI